MVKNKILPLRLGILFKNGMICVEEALLHISLDLNYSFIGDQFQINTNHKIIQKCVLKSCAVLQ